MPYDSEHYTPAVTPSVVEPWQKVLLDAADYIEAHGWNQGEYGSHGGPRCISGAVMSISGTDAWRGVLSFWEQHYGCAPCVWNDAPGRTAAEVCDALRDCARQP